MSTAAKIFHISSLSLYAYVVFFILTNLPKSGNSTNYIVRTLSANRTRYFTGWNLACQIGYLLACILTYVLGEFSTGQKLAGKINSFANYLFTSILAPTSLMLSTVFWIVCSVERELLYPKILDTVIPIWINHVIHTFVAVFVIIDLYLVNHKFPSLRSAIKGMLLLFASYSVCLYGTYFHSGIWLYPIFNELIWPLRMAFSLFIFFVGVFMFGAAKRINCLFWGEDYPQKTIKKSRTA